MSDLEWIQDAACLGVVHEMWDEHTPRPDALRYCFRCRVRDRCAAYGLARPYASDAGVLGGLGFYDRQRIRARKSTLSEAWALRMGDLVRHDWDRALAEDYARTMPRPEEQ